MLNEAAQKIKDVIIDVIADVDVQPGYPDDNGNKNVTWCNRALYRMLMLLNGNTDLLLDSRGINWTSANAMYKNAEKNCVEILSEKSAQERANNGELVAVVAYNPVGSGHVALVCPDEEEYSTEKKTLIGQAGIKCGIMRLKDGFANLPVKYYSIPLIKRG